MDSYIICNPQADAVIPHGLYRNLLERKQLLYKLMSNRDNVRILFAPSLFGKSVMAYQYGKILFPDRGIIWVKADDLRFLRDLDNKSLKNTICSQLSNVSLFSGGIIVFDSVFPLSEKRLGEFLYVLTFLQTIGFEILVTTRLRLFQNNKPLNCLDNSEFIKAAYTRVVAEFKELASKEHSKGSSNFSKAEVSKKSSDNPSDSSKSSSSKKSKNTFENFLIDTYLTEEDIVPLTFSYITAKDLLLDTKEITQVFPSESTSLLGRVCPIVLCDEQNGRKRLFTSLQNLNVCSVDKAVLITALVVSKGSQLLFSCLVEGYSSINLLDFNQYYPHAGLRNRGFISLKLSAEQRFSLLWTHLGKLVEYSLYPTVKEYLAVLLNELVKLEDYSLIQFILMYCLNEDEKAQFYKESKLDDSIINTYIQEQSAQPQEFKAPLSQSFKEQTSETQVIQAAEAVIEKAAKAINLSSSLDMPVKNIQVNESEEKCKEVEKELSARKAKPCISLPASDAWAESDSQLVSDVRAELDSQLAPEAHFSQKNLVGASRRIFKSKLVLSPAIVSIKPLAVTKKHKADTVDTVHAVGEINKNDAANEAKVTDKASAVDGADALKEPEENNRLTINLFGRFEMHRGGKPVPEKGEIRKLAKIMIALLAINSNKDLPRAWVEHAIWPNCFSPSVSSNFYNLWSLIKRTISSNAEERKLLGRTRESISFREIHIESDVQKVNELCNEFNKVHNTEDYVRILSQLEMIYQGPLMPGVDNAQIEAYRNTYQNKVLNVIVEGTRKIFKYGNKYVALHFAAFAFAQTITREDVSYNYMRILKELGNHTIAIDAYWECRDAIVEKYGIDASRRLDGLYAEIIKEAS